MLLVAVADQSDVRQRIGVVGVDDLADEPAALVETEPSDATAKRRDDERLCAEVVGRLQRLPRRVGDAVGRRLSVSVVWHRGGVDHPLSVKVVRVGHCDRRAMSPCMTSNSIYSGSRARPKNRAHSLTGTVPRCHWRV